MNREKSAMEARPVKRILLLSNGYGEDTMGSRLAVQLREVPGVTVTAMPIVGEGHAYTKAGIPTIGPQRNLPSEGFGFNSLKNLLVDLRAGVLGLTFEQSRFMRKVAPEYDWVIGVGDILLVMFNARSLHKPMVFIPTAKSNYIEPHYDVETRLMKEHCVAVFPRDEITASDLRSKGVPARFLGNLMMDCISLTGEDFGLGYPEERPALWPESGLLQDRRYVVGILPGSRAEAYQNLATITGVCRFFDELSEGRTNFLVAWPSNLDTKELEGQILKAGYRFVPSSEEDRKKGIVARIWDDRTSLDVVTGHFGDILRVSDLVLGLAGTGNEQAAGMGKPVVSFVGTGPQYNLRFAKRQEKLLGEALDLVLTKPLNAAHEMWAILLDKERYQRMAHIGRERMGDPGGISRAVKAVSQMVHD